MNEDEKKALAEIYRDLKGIAIKIYEIEKAHPWSIILKDTQNLVSVAVDLIAIDLEDTGD